MALGLRISELTEETTPADADLLEVVHAGANRKMTRANLLSTAAEMKTKIAAQVAAAADKIPIRNASGQVEGDITGTSADSDGLEGYSYAELVAAMKLALHPVGSFYTQYPDASSNTDATEFPESLRPATLFGGTWAEQWADESISFRTRGTLSDTDRTDGLQSGALWGHFHDSDTLAAGGAGSSNTSTNAPTGSTRYVVGRASTIKTDGVNGTPVVAAETRVVNRRIKVWKRTA